MANQQADVLRAKLKAGTALAYLDQLGNAELALLDKSLDAAKQREHEALDKAIEGSMTMIPLLLRGAFKKILFP